MTMSTENVKSLTLAYSLIILTTLTNDKKTGHSIKFNIL